VTPSARRVALAALAGLAASPVHAHLVETGFGAFYDGLAHVAVTPADLLVVVAIALFAGQRGRGAARLALFALPVAWLAGGLVGARWPEATVWPLWTTLTFAVAGALVAVNVKLRNAGVTLLAVVAGLLHGLVNGATMAPGGSAPLALAGAITAIFCATAILSAEATALPAGWPRVAVRVAGSWIAAAGLLMLGWLLRPGGL
jgi:hydrogenase/urease accessory protein HupE